MLNVLLIFFPHHLVIIALYSLVDKFFEILKFGNNTLEF